jgi:hypothetical protein
MMQKAKISRSMLTGLALVAALAGAGQASSASAIAPTLYVNYVGMNCTFTMVTDSGATVSSLAPGSYQLTLTADDFTSCPAAGLPDFSLTGPGVSIQTPIDAGTGAAADYTIALQPSSTYVAQDLSQPLSRLTFTTLASGTPITPAVPYSTTGTGKAGKSESSPIGTSVPVRGAAEPLPLRGTLTGQVTPAGVPELSFKGKTVTRLQSGRYKVSVVDKSKKSGLIVQETGKNGTTIAGTTFTGSRTVTVTLKAGQWFFYPTFVGKKNYFIVTS